MIQNFFLGRAQGQRANDKHFSDTLSRKQNISKNTHAILLAIKNAFCGSLLRHKRKSKRPFSYKQATHLVLRLKPLLPPLFELHDHDLRKLIFTTASKYKIRVYDLVLNHSHMHAVTLLPRREAYTCFIKEVTSLISLHFSNKLDFLGVKLKRVFAAIRVQNLYSAQLVFAGLAPP